MIRVAISSAISSSAFLGISSQALSNPTISRLFSSCRLQSGDSDKMLNRLAAKASLYEKLGQRTEALDVYQRIMQDADGVSKGSFLVTCLNNAGTLFFDQKDYEKALSHYSQAVTKAKENGQEEKALAGIYRNLANTHYALDQMEEAKEYYEKSLAASGGEETLDASSSHLNLGVICIKQRNFDKALEHLQKSLSSRESLKADAEQIRECHEWLSVAYKEKGDYKQAMEHCEKSISL